MAGRSINAESGCSLAACVAELLHAFAVLSQTVLAAAILCCWCCRGATARPQHQCWPPVLHALSCLPVAPSAACKCQLLNSGTLLILIEAQSCRQVRSLPGLRHAPACSAPQFVAASLQVLFCPSEKQPCASLATASPPLISVYTRPVPTACNGMAAEPHPPRPADLCTFLRTSKPCTDPHQLVNDYYTGNALLQ